MRLKIFCAFIATIVIEIHGKPLQESAKELKETSNNIDESKIDHVPEKTDRVNRQIRILLDPNELQDGEDFEDITSGLNHNRVSSRLPIMVNPNPTKEPVNIGGTRNRRPQQSSGIGSRGVIGGMISSLLGSSSGGTRNQSFSLQKADAEERNSRIRRQVEQLVNQLINMNQTKSEKQEDKSESSEEASSDNSPRESDSDSASDEEDEPPGGGDGQGGGILGLLAGLSGEGGQSDLGTLLTTVASIVTNLSGGEGFDLNTLIGSAVALLGGILAGDGMKNIGAQIGGYLITAFDGITGGGAMNNGAFIGNLASTLIGGSSAAGTGSSSEEGGGGSDSGSFFISLLSGLLGSSSGRK